MTDDPARGTPDIDPKIFVDEQPSNITWFGISIWIAVVAGIVGVIGILASLQ